MTTEEDDWLDEVLLADDPKSKRMWKRDAIGTTTPVAMRGIPRYGQITVKVPIADWRTFKRHIDSRQQSMGTWLRQAVGAKMLAEGVPASEIEGFNK